MAVVTFNYDPDAKAQADAGGGRVLPEGLYTLRVDSFTHKPPKEQGKYPQIELKCVIESSPTGNNIGQKITRWLSLSPRATPYRLLPFLRAAGIAFQDHGNGQIVFDDAYLVGARTKAICRHDNSGSRPREDWDGDEPVGGSAQAPAPAAPGAPQWGPGPGAMAPLPSGTFPQPQQPQQSAPQQPQAGPQPWGAAPGQAPQMPPQQQPPQAPQQAPQPQWAQPAQPQFPQQPPQPPQPQQMQQGQPPAWMQGPTPAAAGAQGPAPHVAGQGAPPPRGYGQG